ncbi:MULTISPECIES: DUF6233 domain-containing protein [Streptomyces]|uniref:Uncharacterized protein n=1 Tax=Streptomyces canarius TaxID=285453 RepID=A0ABQ3CQW3_9ACTN|nr:DUF6233 domain-containing protein [Streptomyces canarius]GHA33469.1 hypothetical protein GCM10010345_42510 [Streptomyces canarius]
MRPAPPDWLTQHGPDRDNVDTVHVGGCRAARNRGRGRPATREQSLAAPRSQAPPCVHCRTDTAFGYRGLTRRAPAGVPAGAEPANGCDREGRSPTRRKAMRGFSRTIVLACGG